VTPVDGRSSDLGIPDTYRPRRASPDNSTRQRVLRELRLRALRAVTQVLPYEGAAAALLHGLLYLPDDVISVGRWSYFDGVPTVHRYPGAPLEHIKVGAFCSIAKDVTFMLSGNHDTYKVTTSPVRKLFGVEDYDTSGEVTGRGRIVIGNDVWIGRGALVLSGTKIGDGAVVGARAVVSGTVAPYAVVVGNPAQEVRKRFDPDTVQRLLQSRWWTLPDEQLLKAVDLLSSRDVHGFLDHVDGLRST
jgi:chloramphenicol O-acetyltransferase type B